MPPEQGDRIGRFFAYWVTVSFGQYFENRGSSPNIGKIFGQYFEDWGRRSKYWATFFPH
jgi:hypothetical protein